MDILFLFVLDIIGCLASGFSLMKLWNWFIASTFHLPTLSFAIAFGIGLFISVATVQFIPTDKEKLNEKVVFNIVSPLFAMAMGYAVHLLSN